MIRKLNTDDFEIYQKLRLRAFKDNPEAFSSTYDEALAQDKVCLLQHFGTGDDMFYLGAFEENLIGMVGFRREKGIKDRHKGLVFEMYVVPEKRGHGIGKVLMLELIQQAKCVDGLEQLHLSVVTSNTAACQLYRSLGFKVYGMMRKALKMDKEYWNNYLMVLHLL